VGTNGIGKSTALKILAGKLKPNLGRYEEPQPDWQEILTYFRGSELQNYFTKILEDQLKAIIKPQYVDNIPKAAPKKTVQEILEQKNERGNKAQLIEELDLSQILDRQVQDLSGGELQRFAIALACIQNADVYMFDEPSSYLDIRQRLRAARVVRQILETTKNDIKQKYEHIQSLVSFSFFLSEFLCKQRDLRATSVVSFSTFCLRATSLILILFCFIVQICDRCRARSQCVGLPLRSDLLLVRSTRCLRSGDITLLCTRRNQHLSCRLRTHGKSPLS
jgi:ABC-type lipoprotein export system ATPase subunit